MNKRMIHLIFLPFILFSCNSNEFTITFHLDLSNEENVTKVAIRGDVQPLSFEKDYLLTDKDGDGIYTGVITFRTSKKNLKFKFSKNGKTELQGDDNRVLWFKEEPIEKNFVFNEFEYYNQARINKLKYTKEQIKEDIEALKVSIQYVHPNIYKYRDSLTMQNDFLQLEKKINENPNITTVYKEVSKFLALIKCSHTFTNPWNQGPDIEKALFYQHDKIPFTFNRLGKRLFINKNASEDNRLKKGLEILKINGISAEEIMTTLAEHITSDGNNYQKKLERLVLTGEDKYALFDIFYPLAYGSNSFFELELRHPQTNEITQTTVKAISKTQRTKLLLERYGDMTVKFEDGWTFKMLDESTGYLGIKSFVIEGKDFDWKDFLDNVFKQLSQHKAKNFIIDIRANEGGQDEVAEYILRRIIKQPLFIPPTNISVRYETIPDELKSNISTWSKVPYSFKGKYRKKQNGRYYLKPKYGVKAKTYKPHKDGFKGKVYLITDASNSSATHLMASYASIIDGVTIVGQETGGNVQGLNAGFIFFLRLPNSRVEIDIPVLSIKVELPNIDGRDGGIIPQIPIAKVPSDFLNDEDTVLQKFMAQIKQ